MSKRKSELVSDVDKAAEIYCQVLDDTREVSVGGNKVEGRRVAKRLRAAPVGRRRKIGRAALAKYRADNNVVGAINWEAFREWMSKHTAEITALGIILKILTLLLML